MYESGAREAFHQNFEIHSPCVKCSGPRICQIWPYSENVLNFRTVSSLLLQLWNALLLCTWRTNLLFLNC